MRFLSFILVFIISSMDVYSQGNDFLIADNGGAYNAHYTNDDLSKVTDAFLEQFFLERLGLKSNIIDKEALATLIKSSHKLPYYENLHKDFEKIKMSPEKDLYLSFGNDGVVIGDVFINFRDKTIAIHSQKFLIPMENGFINYTKLKKKLIDNLKDKRTVSILDLFISSAYADEDDDSNAALIGLAVIVIAGAIVYETIDFISNPCGKIRGEIYDNLRRLKSDCSNTVDSMRRFNKFTTWGDGMQRVLREMSRDGSRTVNDLTSYTGASCRRKLADSWHPVLITCIGPENRQRICSEMTDLMSCTRRFLNWRADPSVRSWDSDRNLGKEIRDHRQFIRNNGFRPPAARRE